MFLTENSLSLPSETSKMENSWDNEKRIELSETIHVIWETYNENSGYGRMLF